jgi:arylformamidase
MTTTSSPRRADIDSFYTCRHPDQFQINWRAFYESAERRTDAVRDRWLHKLDVAYGLGNPRQRLDVYFPLQAAPGVRPKSQGPERRTAELRSIDAPGEAGMGMADASSAASPGAPIVLFLHGGGFREGDPALYGFLAEPFLKRGVIFASAGYRLTPETYLPDTFQDAEAVVRFCRTEFGKGPLYLAGHSAGGILTAQIGVQHGDLLAAAIPISGVYDFRDYGDFFADDSQRSASSPLLNITSPAPRWLVAYGSLENRPNYGIDSQRLVEALRQHGATADFLELDGQDHCGAVEALADESSPLFQAVDRLILS